MIDCPNGEMRDQLPDYLHEQLPAAARAKVATHVASCAACSAELALLRELRGSMQLASAVDVGKIVAALPSRPHRGRNAQVGSTRWHRFDWRVAAAIVALAAGGGTAAILSRGPGPAGTPEPVASNSAAQQVATSAGVVDAYLSEASTVELEALLDDLESFDGLPAGEPEPVAAPSDAEEGL